MANDKEKFIAATERRRAEKEQLAPEAEKSRRSQDSQRLLQELQIHQIELKQQNTELRQARDEVEQSLEKYTDLYDFAPVGYFTLDDNGKITAANLCGAALLGSERARLIGRRFSQYIIDEDRDLFTPFLGTLCTHPAKEVCEVGLQKKDKSPLFVQIEGMRHAAGEEYRLALIDITARRKMAEENIAYQERLRFMSAEILLVEERERRQLAISLHDQISQVLALAKIKLGALQGADSAEEGRQSADEIRELLEQAITSSRNLTYELSPPILYELGFESAVQALCEKFERQHKVPIAFVTDRQAKLLAKDMQILLYRAVRELLVNIVKHARAESIEVSCRCSNDQVVIVVADNGIGFAPALTIAPPQGSSGFGLFSNRESLHHLGGHLTVDSLPGRGTRVTLTASLLEEKKERDYFGH